MKYTQKRSCGRCRAATGEGSCKLGYIRNENGNPTEPCPKPLTMKAFQLLMPKLEKIVEPKQTILQSNQDISIGDTAQAEEEHDVIHHYLFDTENIGHYWETLCKLMKNGQHNRYYLFWTQKTCGIPLAYIEQLKELLMSDALKLIECYSGQKNALDFQLVLYLGRLLERNLADEFIIVSADRGFDSVIQHGNKYRIRRMETVSTVQKSNQTQKKLVYHQPNLALKYETLGCPKDFSALVADKVQEHQKIKDIPIKQKTANLRSDMETMGKRVLLFYNQNKQTLVEDLLDTDPEM